MYLTEQHKREVLRTLAKAGGSITFALKGDLMSGKLSFTGPNPTEVWQVGVALSHVGLVKRGGIDEQCGTETLTLTREGWTAVENPSKPLPLPEGVKAASDSGLGFYREPVS